MTEDLASFIRDVPDFPNEGILFKDISPLLADRVAFERAVKAMAAPFIDARVDLVAGIEARGFIFATPVARVLGAGFVPIRKAGKLPSATRSVSYDLEYGSATIEIHDDAIAPGTRVLIVDDVLATGGTAAAAARLVGDAGGVVVGVSMLMELTVLGGREQLGALHTTSVLTY